LVAAVAIGRMEAVIVVHVAGRARGRRRGPMRAGQGETGHAVIEGRSGPARCRVATGAIRRRKSGAGSGVHRSKGLLPGRQMASGVTAIGWLNRQTVVVIDVTQIAGHIGMSARQRESGRAVIERGGRPTDGRMTGRAVRQRKSGAGGGVHRSKGLLPGRQMASGISAFGRCHHQVVIVTDMTKRTSQIRVAIGQQKTGRAVVELGVQPTVKGMARGAIRNRKLRSSRLVHRIRRLLPIRHVAGQACRRKPQIISNRGVPVALLALGYRVRA
jgi:hypothetical protein